MPLRSEREGGSLLEALNLPDIPVMAGLVETFPISSGGGWRSFARVICIDDGITSGTKSLMIGMKAAIVKCPFEFDGQASLVSARLRIMACMGVRQLCLGVAVFAEEGRRLRVRTTVLL